MKKPNILIVEDEYITALDLKTQLILKGYHCYDMVASGEEAIRRVTYDKIDLVLMDIKLKGEIDGIETARIIKQKHNIPIIFISGNTDLLNSDRLKAIPPDGIIRKPIMAYELFEQIEKMLKKYS